MQDRTPPSSLENAIAVQKFGVGQPARRKEDDTLVRGKGKYTDDFSLPNQAYAWLVRSSHAHGLIKGIDTEAARTMPGVLGVWTAKDLAAANYNPFICGLPLKSRDGSPLLQTNRTALANDKVRILSANVGGSFGMKNVNYPEYVCILHAARMLGRPVKWTDERSTSFLSDSHGRGQLIHGELALDAEGHFLAVRLSGHGNLGAYITGVAPGPLSLNTGKNLASVYRTPLLGVDIKTVLTNTTLMGAYRGAGRPEANYFMERLIDRAADELGINRLTLRTRNFIKPAQLPFPAVSGLTYDSGDFQGVFTKALEISDHANFARRKKESRKAGLLRGIAIGSYLEVTAPPSGELGKITFEPDGTVKLTTGTLDYGQGHATPFAQVLSAQLGVPFDKITM